EAEEEEGGGGGGAGGASFVSLSAPRVVGPRTKQLRDEGGTGAQEPERCRAAEQGLSGGSPVRGGSPASAEAATQTSAPPPGGGAPKGGEPDYKAGSFPPGA
ncbi:unnamed protein product, partial [Prorocentrum cordatum]